MQFHVGKYKSRNLKKDKRIRLQVTDHYDDLVYVLTKLENEMSKTTKTLNSVNLATESKTRKGMLR